MNRTIAIIVTLTGLSLGALAQAPSPAPAPAPDMKPPADGRGMRPGMQDRARWSGGGGGMENPEFGLERIIGAIAMGQEFGKKLNLTAEQQELIKKLALDQRTKLVEMKLTLQKAALKQTEVLMADPLDEAALMAAVEETSKVRTEIAKAQIRLLLDMRKTLTEEQRKMLRELMLQAKQAPQMPMRQGRDGERGGDRGERGGARERGDAPRTPAPVPAPVPAPAPAPAPAPVPAPM